MDTVFVTEPDEEPAVLQPTLTDAIAASQFYFLAVQAMQATILTAVGQANISAAIAQAAANAAGAASTGTFTIAANEVIPVVVTGTSTIASISKLKRQLTTDGNYQIVADYIMNNLGGTATEISWTSGYLLPAPGLVYSVIKLAIPYTDAQALTLWSNAFALTD